MAIEDFNGECFVAFTDISGFKEMMKDDRRAAEAIESFYESAYSILKERNDVNGLFISDCGVIFTREGDKTVQLTNILQVVRQINEEVLRKNIMLTTSISWGHFRYQNRIEVSGIIKQPIYGNAYLSAYLDNEVGKPKLQPGQCRILKTGIDEQVFQSVEQREMLDGVRAHQYYYWMVEESQKIQEFKQRYKDSYNLRYAGILKALKGDYH